MAYPTRIPLQLHHRRVESRRPLAHNLPVVSFSPSPMASPPRPSSHFFDPARSAVEENSRQASVPPHPRISLLSPPSSPARGRARVTQTHSQHLERSPLNENRVYIKREEPSPFPSPCPAVAVPPAPASTPTPTSPDFPATMISAVAGAFELAGYDGCSSLASSSSGSSSGHEGTLHLNNPIPEFYTHRPPLSSRSGDFSPIPILARAQRQHDLLVALERICTAAAETYWYSQHHAAVDQHSQRYPLHVVRSNNNNNGAHYHTPRFQPYPVRPQQKQQGSYPPGLQARSYVHHPQTIATRHPLALMDYLLRIAQLLWTRATRAGEHAEELEAVHRMGNLYAWGEKVVGAVAASAATVAAIAVREGEMERANVRLGFMRDGNGNGNGEGDGDGDGDEISSTNTNTNADTDANADETNVEGGRWVRVENSNTYNHEPEPGTGTGIGAGAQVWVWRKHEWIPQQQSQLEQQHPVLLRRTEGAVLTEEALMQVVMAGRDLVGWLLSEDGKREVDALWVGRGVLF